MNRNAVWWLIKIFGLVVEIVNDAKKGESWDIKEEKVKLKRKQA